MELKGLKINFLGDSITEGCGCSSEETRFTNKIAAEYGAVCRNYGIGGTRIAYQHQPSWDPRCDRHFVLRAKEMDPDADLVCVFGGTNDFGHGDAAFGSFEDRTEHTFYGALHLLFTGLMEKYPAAQIMVITSLHRFDELVPNMHGKVLKDYVQAVREVAEYYGLPVLDLFATYSVQPAVPVMKETYMPDGLHPNDAGHVILTRKIADYIRRL